MTIGWFHACLLTHATNGVLLAQVPSPVPKASRFAVAADDLRTGRCKAWARRPARLSVDVPVPDTAVFTNWTDKFWFGLSVPWDIAASRAVASLAELSMKIRLACGMPYANTACLEGPDVWRAAWCLFSRRLAVQTRWFPEEAFVVSALGTSAAAVFTEGLPGALAGPLVGFLSGSITADALHVALNSAILLFRDYVVEAMMLGWEMGKHGFERVADARFELSLQLSDVNHQNGGFYRADVLLWLLRDLRSKSGGPPLVVELGVDTGENSQQLLAGHPDLRWIGVDLYPFDTWVDHLLQARKRLMPWLGDRAHLVMSKSDAVASVLAVDEEVDLLFVDADHSETGVVKDLAAWAPRVRSGGIVAGHDYHSNHAGVPRAVHRSIPKGATLHLGPDVVWWWRVP